MIENPSGPCSPYLLKERRDLAVACRQISDAHGRTAPPCGACPLKDVCRHWRRATLKALPLPKRTPSNDPGPAQAA